MALSKKRNYQRHSEPKLFQCTGFGDCHMVFTRSEHLARHSRKHTGEKPFKCVVPGCERAFSRFDNMIQHTSTHNKKNNKNTQDKKPSNIKPFTKEEMNLHKNSIQHLVPRIATPMDMGYSSTRVPRLSLPISPVSDMESLCYQQLPSINESYFQHAQMASATSPSMDYFTHINNATSNATSPMHPSYLPLPKESLHYQLPLYPTKSINEYDHTADSSDTWSSISSPSPSSPASISSSTLSPLPLVLEINFLPPQSPISCSVEPTRRLSTMELALPIQQLTAYHGVGDNGIDVTNDEFEALQAFSQLSSYSSTTTSSRKSRPNSASYNVSATQVNAFRQHLALSHESSSRLSPRSSI